MQEKMTIAQRVTYVLSGNDNKIVTELTTEVITPQSIENAIENAIKNEKMIWVKGSKTTVMINPKYLAAVLVEDKEVEL